MMESEAVSKNRTWTIIGLAIAFLGIPAITTALRPLASTSDQWVVFRELSILALTGLLLWVVVKKEGLPLSSIGLAFERPWRALLTGLAYTVLFFALLLGVLAVYQLLGVKYGEGASISHALPVALLTVIRAGISEEIIYRGYLLERLESLSGSKWLAGAVSVAAFAGFHYSQGWPGIVIAGVLGAAITGLYWWKRALLPLIIAHFMVDFIPNVLGPLLG